MYESDDERSKRQFFYHESNNKKNDIENDIENDDSVSRYTYVDLDRFYALENTRPWPDFP